MDPREIEKEAEGYIIAEKLWEVAFRSKVTKITDQIDLVFQKEGFAIPRARIEHFVVSCLLRKDAM